MFTYASSCSSSRQSETSMSFVRAKHAAWPESLESLKAWKHSDKRREAAPYKQESAAYVIPRSGTEKLGCTRDVSWWAHRYKRVQNSMRHCSTRTSKSSPGLLSSARELARASSGLNPYMILERQNQIVLLMAFWAIWQSPLMSNTA